MVQVNKCVELRPMGQGDDLILEIQQGFNGSVNMGYQAGLESNVRGIGGGQRRQAGKRWFEPAILNPGHDHELNSVLLQALRQGWRVIELNTGGRLLWHDKDICHRLHKRRRGGTAYLPAYQRFSQSNLKRA